MKVKNLEEAQRIQREIYNRSCANGPFIERVAGHIFLAARKRT